MLIRDVMTAKPACCKPADTIDKVARLMVDHDCGEIPVCDGDNLVGVITDRDLAVRAVAAGRVPVTVPASEVMTSPVHSVRENDPVEQALIVMDEKLVRRLPVLDEKGALVGIVSQADLIAKIPTLKVARAMMTVARKTRREPRQKTITIL